MTKVPLQVRLGTLPEPKIGESQFRKIEASVRRFKNCRDFSVDPEVREKIREAARWYCVRTFMNAEGATVADVKRSMKLLIASAGKLEKTIEQLTGRSNPNSTVISAYLTKHGFSDLEDLLYPLAGLKLFCEQTIADVRRHERKGPDPDDALNSLIWTLADIFAQKSSAPTTNYSTNSNRNTAFTTFAWGVYISLPHAEGALSLAAFQERAHRIRKKWSEKQGKKRQKIPPT